LQGTRISLNPGWNFGPVTQKRKSSHYLRSGVSEARQMLAARWQRKARFLGYILVEFMAFLAGWISVLLGYLMAFKKYFRTLFTYIRREILELLE
jgi:hypothetical protein